VHIINCARGGIVNEMDLLASLEAGHVGGAALDVYEKVRRKGGRKRGRENAEKMEGLFDFVLTLPPSLPPSLPP